MGPGRAPRAPVFLLEEKGRDGRKPGQSHSSAGLRRPCPSLKSLGRQRGRRKPSPLLREVPGSGGGDRRQFPTSHVPASSSPHTLRGTGITRFSRWELNAEPGTDISEPRFYSSVKWWGSVSDQRINAPSFQDPPAFLRHSRKI